MGLGKTVFDVIEGYGDWIDVNDYMSLLRANREEAESMLMMWTAMQNEAVPMRSAQIHNLNGWVDEMPKSGGNPETFPVHLTWSNQYYTGTEWTLAPPINLAQGIRIWQLDNNENWQLLQTLSPSSTQYTYDARTDEIFTYMVSAYNPLGNSVWPEAVECTIAGKLANGESGQHGANNSSDNCLFRIDDVRSLFSSNQVTFVISTGCGGGFQYRLLDAAGRIHSEGLVSVESDQRKKVSLSPYSLSPGVYFLIVNSQGLEAAPVVARLVLDAERH